MSQTEGVSGTGEPQPPQQQPQIVVKVPEAQSAGVYANGFAVWFNQTDFTLDGVVHLPMDRQVNAQGQAVFRQPVEVVSRVKFPPALIFRLIQQLNEVMTRYEQQFGEIKHLGPPIPPPSDNHPDQES